VGNLKSVWTDLPDPDEEASFKETFYGYFGYAWEQVLLGAEKPFAHHRYWDGYWAVTDVQPDQGLTVSDVAGPGCDGLKPLCYNISISI